MYMYFYKNCIISLICQNSIPSNNNKNIANKQLKVALNSIPIYIYNKPIIKQFIH